MSAWGPRVAHQARLLGRSARHLAHSPADGRELPRLVATGGRSTMRLRLPWLPYRLIDDLSLRVGPGSRVLEFGGGGSTLWFLDRGASLITVEDHEGWAARLAASVGSATSWELRHRPVEGGAYAAAADDLPDSSLDVVLVDGKVRPACIRAVVGKVRPGGVLLVDDVDRPEYAGVLASVPWPRTDVVGFAPAKPTLAYTAVLTRS